MSSYDYIDLAIMNISDKDYLSYLTKKHKIHEEIRDCVIDRFLRIIYQQNNEIILLKKKLEDTIKKSLLIIKKNILKKKLSPVNQINLSFIKNTKKISFLVKNMLSIENNKDNNNNTAKKNDTKSFIHFNRLNKKNQKKIPSFDNKVNHINSNNLLNYINKAQSYRNNNKNYFEKNLTCLSDNKFLIDKKNSLEPISLYSYSKKIFPNNNLDNKSEDKGKALNEYAKKIINHNSFFYENNNQNSIKSLTIQSSKKKNKIRIISIKLKNFKLTNLSINNNIFDKCPTERSNENKEQLNYLFSLQNNYFNKLNKKNISKNCNYICKNSFSRNKMNKKLKLNKYVLKLKELNKNLVSTYHQKTEDNIIINDMNGINISNYIPKTDRLLYGKNAKNKIVYNFGEKGKENLINNDISNEDNTFQTIYNPTFVSFLNRKKNL